jgi:hypothetical protein
MAKYFKRTARSTRTRRLVLLGVLVGIVAGLALGVTGALAAPAPPPPSITGSPANPTNQTSASFTFTDSQAGVTFNCKLDNAAFAPCTSPQSYSGPLAAGNHTFQVQAVAGGKTSGNTQAAWTIDLTPPAAPNITSSPANPTNQTTASFSFTDEPGATFTCQLDVGAALPCTSPQSYGSLGGGSHTFTVRAKDAAGNTGPASSYMWSIDLTPPPAPSITAFPPNPTNVKNGSFSFSDTESPVTFQCKLDAGAYAPCTSPKTTGDQPDGSHTFSVQAIDAAGNPSTPSSYTWTIDTKPPPPPTIAGPPNPDNHSSATFTFSDTEAGVTYLCKLDPAPSFTACSNTATFSGLGAGAHNLHVEAVDAAGNVGAQTEYHWTIDLTAPPTPSLTSTATNPMTATSASFSFTDTEAGVTFVCQLDVGVPAPCTSPKAYTGLSDASHTFTVQAKDAAGNLSSPASFTWTVDTTPPAPPTITSFPANPTNQTSATFAFTGEAGASFLCSLDGAAFAACTSTKSYGGIAAGSHTFRVEARDAAGNTGSPAAYTWTVDLTAPTVASINRADPNPSNAGPLHWTVTFSEPVDGVGPGNFGLVTGGLGGSAPTVASAAAVGGAPSATWTVTVSTTGTTGTNAGSIQLNLTAKSPIADVAGNALAGTTPIAGQAYTFDTTPPAAPTITNGPPQLPSWTTTTSASFSFTGDAGVTFLCSTNSTNPANFTACSSPASYSGVAQGLNTFYVEARDAAGNVGATASRQWKVDTIPPAAPTFTLTPPDPNSTATSNFDWTPHLPAADVDHYECSVENATFGTTVPSVGGPSQPCTPPLTYAVGTTNSGQHQFAVRAVDAAGNVSTAIFYTWKVVKNSGQDYTMTATVTQPLSPGAPAQPIDIVFNSANAGNGGSGVDGTQVSNLTIAISSITGGSAGPNLCTPADFVITQIPAGVYPFYVPFGTRNLSSLLTPAQMPTIQMLNRHDSVPGNGSGNQDACKHATVNLTFTGTP